MLLQASTTLNRTTTLNPTTTGNPTTTPNLTTIPKRKTPFGNITTPADETRGCETPENNTQSTQNRSTPDSYQEEIIERIASKYLFSELKNHVLSSEVHSGFLN